MHLVSLDIVRAPGLPASGLRTGELSPGLVVLFGPNASGKSTLGRVMRGLLWPSLAPSDIQATAQWRPVSGGPVIDAALIYGQTQWSETGFDQLDKALASATHLRLQDLLDTDNDSDQAIARQIQTELDGGFDLTALTAVARPVHRPGRTAKRELTEATNELKMQVDLTDALAADEARLQGLKEQAEQAVSAPARLQQVNNALDLLDLLDDLASHRAQLLALPPVSDGLSEDLPDDLRDAESAYDKLQRKLDPLVASVKEALDERDANAFVHAPPSDEVLAAWAERADDRVDEDRRIVDLRIDLAAARAAMNEARADVLTPDALQTTPSRSDLEQLSTALDKQVAAQAEVERHAPPQGPAPLPLDAAAEERLADARHLLSEWLTAPRPLVVASQPAPSPVLAAALVVGGLLLALVGLIVALLIQATVGAVLIALATALIGLGLGLFLGPRLTRPATTPPASQADTLQKRYEEGSYMPVKSWSTADVQAAVDSLRTQLAASAADRKAAVLYSEQDRAATQAQAKLDDAQRALEALVDALNLDPSLPGLALSLQATRIYDLAQARDRFAALQAKLNTLEQQHSDALQALRDEVCTLGIHEAEALSGPVALRAAIDAIDKRLGRLRQAQTDVARSQADLVELREQRQEALARRDALLGRAGLTLDTRHELPQRLDLWRSRSQLIQVIRELERRSSALSIPDDLPHTRQELEDLSGDLTQAKDTLDELHKDMASIREAIRSATQGRSIQEAIGKVQEAEEAIVADRERQRQAHVEAGLIEWLRNERASTDAPQLLRRARERFLAFTHNRYELVVDPHLQFLARDLVRDRLQKLSELSDGTRIQLLLAARLAWLESAEGHTRLPLFLDEVLSITDSERFASVGSAILSLCTDGRQVFYATADAAEVYAWSELCRSAGLPPPQIVQLGDAEPQAAWDPPPALPAARATLPPVNGLDAIAWTRSAGLDRPQLQHQVDEWPLSLVLYDALTQVRDAASQGLRTAGQLELADRGIPLPLADEWLKLARTRARVVQATLDALRVGRGRPVSWPDLEQSGWLTAAFEDRVRDLALELGSEPQRFYDEVCALPRFRSNNKEELRIHLEDGGFIDPRDPLSHPEVVVRAQAALRTERASASHSLADVEALVTFVRDVVGIS